MNSAGYETPQGQSNFEGLVYKTNYKTETYENQVNYGRLKVRETR